MRPEIDIRQDLATSLQLIQVYDEVKNYEARNRTVLWAMAEAAQLGYQVGIRIDLDEPEWPVVYIELPEGQVSWHLPQHSKEWDGHGAKEKYERTRNHFLSWFGDWFGEAA